MTDNELKYWAFLSCSQQDNCEERPDTQDVSSLCWGNWLHDALKTFSIPAEFVGQINSRGEIIPERIDPIFQDDQETPGDASLGADVCKALEQSICLIVICSPRSAKSLYVNETVRYFKQLGRGNYILPIVVAGEPNASDASKPGMSPENECFVPALRHPVQPDGTLDPTRRAARHIFVDARHGDDKREILANDHRNAEADLEMAKIQLIALLIGVGFNGLWWREQKRHFFDFAEAQRQAREALSQVEEARRQTREAQNKVLEIQNLPADVHGQIQEAQNQALEAQNQAREAQKQLQEFQNKARDTQSQLEEARNRALAAESRVLEAQNQAREAQSQLEAARNKARDQVREPQNTVLEIQNPDQDVQRQIQEAQSLVQEAQNQAREAQSQVQEFQNQARSAQSQLEEARNQAREAQSKVLEAQNQAREARSQVEEIQKQTQDVQGRIQEAQNKVLEARNQAEAAQRQVQEIQNKTRKARRLTKVLALIAVLTLLAAGVAASIALRQRVVARQALAKMASEAVWSPDLAQGGLNQEQIRQALRKMGGAEQTRSLDQLAVRIPPAEIPETLKASSVILDDQQRSHFQKWLLVRLGWLNPQSAMTNASVIDGKIVNDDGVSDSNLYLQLAVLDNWMRTDLSGAFNWVCQLPDADSRSRALKKIIPALASHNPQNALARLNDLQPVPDERIYALLFQRWAAKDPVQAIQQREQIPGHDQGDNILCAIMTVWVDQQPDAALDWVKSQPDSESRNKALETCIQELAKSDASRALALAESLPEGAWRCAVVAGLFNDWAARDLEAATTACQRLPDDMDKDAAWKCVLNQRIAKYPASAAESVKNLPPGDYRQNAVEELCRHWAVTDAPAALTWAQSLPSEAEQVAAFNQVVANWARKDPQAAMQFAGQHPGLSGDALGKIAEAWSQSNWTAATNWVESLLDGEKKDAALAGLSETWAQNDPKGMATYALGLPAGDVQTRYLAAACRQLAIRDWPGTVELLEQLSDAALRQNILEQAARDCDPLHLDQAAKYIAAMPAGDDQKAAIKGLLLSWTPADPETAADWLCSFPETNSQPEQVGFVIKAWSQREPAAVARWLANLPTGTASDGMTNAFLEGVVGKYPEYARQWIQSETNAGDETRPEEIMRPQNVPLPWTKFFLNPDLGSPAIFQVDPLETEILSNTTNGPVQLKSAE